MTKINLKNSIQNPLMQYIKQNTLSVSLLDKKLQGSQCIETIKISTTDVLHKRQVSSLVSDYGTQLYHNTTFNNQMMLKNKFNYSSNDYESISARLSEIELPNYYIENTNDQAVNYEELKSLETKKITKEYISNLSTHQDSLRSRNQLQLVKYSNLVFGNSYLTNRSEVNLDEFPYYNTIMITSNNQEDKLNKLLKKISFQEEFLAGILTNQETVDVGFQVNQQEITVAVNDLFQSMRDNSMKLNVSNKIVLGTEKKNSNFMINNFKKKIVEEFFVSRVSGDLLSFPDMLSGTEVNREVFLYRLDKFVDNDSSPIQTVWLFDPKNYYDYQIKRDRIYRYKLSCYCLIYGIQTQISEVKEEQDGVRLTVVSSPSYKYVPLEFGEEFIKVTPKIPVPPHVSFHNENNVENSIKIYLSLNKDSFKSQFIAVTEADGDIISDIPTKDGLYDFDYELQDGKFEVFRLLQKPESIEDFSDAKILDVRNNISTTDVMFKENVKPNTKYYFMFRSVNVIGVPSNPSAVYEIELIKSASNSKITVKTVSLVNELTSHDKTFKRLIQIKPAFQQEVFDDTSQQVQDLSTFKKNINDLTLGTAIDKLWGKKFKIRVKSKDTGKILDLNVKFNLIKDNIK